jgi:3-hydroxyacyl-CoA dehydrogenase
MIGVHYTYAQMPVGDLIDRALHMGRNHYDRVVHFSFGFLLTYLGGPFKYMDSLGLEKVADMLEKLKEKYGERFTPSKKLTEKAAKKENFY